MQTHAGDAQTTERAQQAAAAASTRASSCACAKGSATRWAGARALALAGRAAGLGWLPCARAGGWSGGAGWAAEALGRAGLARGWVLARGWRGGEGQGLGRALSWPTREGWRGWAEGKEREGKGGAGGLTEMG